MKFFSFLQALRKRYLFSIFIDIYLSFLLIKNIENNFYFFDFFVLASFFIVISYLSGKYRINYISSYKKLLICIFIYSCPPLIRLTDLGIRLVDKEIIEAAESFGANRKQKLWGVQLPLALPNIMQGINQCTMMALAMVVIASMIGTRGLGDEVLLGLQQLNVGSSLEAGLAIVLLAIVFDRITQAYGEKIQARTQPPKKKHI